MTAFRWLHLTDLHVGVGSQGWLWPSFKTRFLEDLSLKAESCGPWHAVLFSGDLTQSASREEFDRLDQILDDIWQHLGGLGSNPALISVPGNHDLVWPSELDALLLQPYWSSQVLRDALFSGGAPTQFEVIRLAFQNYTQWRDRRISAGTHATPTHNGIMPGDASYVLSEGDERISVIGLNSAWLNLGKGKSKGVLSVDPRQLLSITAYDPDKWNERHSINLLMTHHPIDWLHETSQQTWRSEVHPPERFDIHLFGHMHEQDFATTSHGGGADLRSSQGSALFGLEYLGDGSTKRVQGYALNKIVDSEQSRNLQVWPRILTRQRDGSHKIAADTSLGLSDGESFTRAYTGRAALKDSSPGDLDDLPTGAVASFRRPLAEISAELEKIRYFVDPHLPHRNVRRLELHNAVGALEERKGLWISSEWGMGEDGFLAAIQDHFGERGTNTYRLDMSGYKNRQQFLDEAPARFGASFETLCENISTAGAAYVLLNDIPIEQSVEAGMLSIVRDMEQIANLIAEYATSAKIILRTQRSPRGIATNQVIELKPLDEADVAIYLRDSNQIDTALRQPEKVSQIHRLTDGVPSRIDGALKELEVTSLDELISANSDLSPTAIAGSAPMALVNAVAELELSSDKAEQRSFDLLKVLAALPQGEQLAYIARLNGPIPFRSQHALDLTSRSLLDRAPLVGLGAQESTTSKALIVPRSVREYLRSRLDDGEAEEMDRKLLYHYFGNDWRSGQISSSHAGRRASNALCSNQEILNASTLIVRLLRRSVQDDLSDDINAAITLATAFIVCLDSGIHHRGAVTFCDDVMQLIPSDGRERQLTVLAFERARAQRMCGMLSEACDTLQTLNYSLLTKEQKQAAKLNLALSLQAQGRSEEAVQNARECIAFDKRSSIALHAETIIARQEVDADDREKKLNNLLLKSTRKKSTINTNNIVLTLAISAKKRGEYEVARDHFRDVITRARRESDFYNGARAIAGLASMHPRGTSFPLHDKMRLIDAYHFSYHERRSDLFDQCHNALWNIFEDEGDIENLLSLFRHSSFIWRINGRDKLESTYIDRLRTLKNRMLNASRDREYFFVRVVLFSNIIAATSLPAASSTAELGDQ